MLRASVRAQRATGAPLSIHPGFNAQSPWDAVRIVEQEGGDLERTIMCHVEQRLRFHADARKRCGTEFHAGRNGVGRDREKLKSDSNADQQKSAAKGHARPDR